MMVSRKIVPRMTIMMLALFASSCAPDEGSPPSDKTPPEAAQTPADQDAQAAQKPLDAREAAPSETQYASEAAPTTGPLESVQEKILALLGTIKSFRGTIDVHFSSTYLGDWVESHTTGTVEYEFQGDKVLYHFDLVTEKSRFTEGEEKRTVETQVLLCDGDNIYQIGEEDGQPVAIKANVDKLSTAVPSEEFFFHLHRFYDVTLMPDEKFDGHDVWVLRGAVKKEEDDRRLKTDTYFRKDIPVMVKTVNYDRYDNVIQTTEIKNIEIDVKMDPQRFKFEPTPDMKIEDQSW